VARDAFAAFNSSHSGALTCSELFGGLVWLGMRCDVALVHDIVRTVDVNADGYVSWEEFKKVQYSLYHQVQYQTYGLPAVRGSPPSTPTTTSPGRSSRGYGPLCAVNAAPPFADRRHFSIGCAEQPNV
jgi:EF-hand domain pair